MLVIALAGVLVWLLSQGGGGPGEPKLGQQVKAFELPDVISGQTFSLADYLGKNDIVIVSYMGWF